MAREDVLCEVIHVANDERVSRLTPRHNVSIRQIIQHGEQLFDEIACSGLLLATTATALSASSAAFEIILILILACEAATV